MVYEANGQVSLGISKIQMVHKADSREWDRKRTLIMLCVLLPILCAGVYSSRLFYENIFRLSHSQVSKSLAASPTQCKSLKDCQLMPGDILIRRYVTSRTWAIDRFGHPFFTHSAFYLGDNQIVEAVGSEENSAEDIQIAMFSKSDWLNSDIESFVVFRPKYLGNGLLNIQNSLVQIANDPEYRFGLPQFGYKQTTCADLIFGQLQSEHMIQATKVPYLLTPDYLFFTLLIDVDGFKIIGHNEL